jgi:competence ComEA-like helix-hairpin-helix protein
MKLKKSHFVFTRQQRSGIFFLLVIIVVLQCIYFFVDFSNDITLTEKEQQELKAFQKEIDSLKQEKLAKSKPNIFPFNPNYLDDYKAYQLNIPTEAVDKLKAFRSQDKFVNSAKEFQKVTEISDSLLATISPYFKFPEWEKPRKIVPDTLIEKPLNPAKIILKDLNGATAQELQKVNGIGQVLSERIIKFRNLLGGFVTEDQLLDVYGLTPEVVNRAKQYFKVLSSPSITKININTASAYNISRCAYIKYGLAKKIVMYREEVGRISNFTELTKIQDFPANKIERIKLYLTLN